MLVAVLCGALAGVHLHPDSWIYCFHALLDTPCWANDKKGVLSDKPGMSSLVSTIATAAVKDLSSDEQWSTSGRETRGGTA